MTIYWGTRTEPKQARIQLHISLNQLNLGPETYCLLICMNIQLCGQVVDTGGKAQITIYCMDKLDLLYTVAEISVITRLTFKFIVHELKGTVCVYDKYMFI